MYQLNDRSIPTIMLRQWDYFHLGRYENELVLRLIITVQVNNLPGPLSMYNVMINNRPALYSVNHEHEWKYFDDRSGAFKTHSCILKFVYI